MPRRLPRIKNWRSSPNICWNITLDQTIRHQGDDSRPGLIAPCHRPDARIRCQQTFIGKLDQVCWTRHSIQNSAPPVTFKELWVWYFWMLHAPRTSLIRLKSLIIKSSRKVKALLYLQILQLQELPSEPKGNIQSQQMSACLIKCNKFSIHFGENLSAVKWVNSEFYYELKELCRPVTRLQWFKFKCYRL